MGIKMRGKGENGNRAVTISCCCTGTAGVAAPAHRGIHGMAVEGAWYPERICCVPQGRCAAEGILAKAETRTIL